MTLGQEFDGFFATLKEDVARLREGAALFREVNLGATAIGTGINSDPRYSALAIEELGRITALPLVPATNLIEATSRSRHDHAPGICERCMPHNGFDTYARTSDEPNDAQPLNVRKRNAYHIRRTFATIGLVA